VYASGTRVTGFRVERGSAAGVETDRGPVSAPAVVSAAGPWSRPLFAAIGFDLPIEPE
jgi:glycine/D-amino acid oxidase-like deaminating enzyme